MLSLWKKWQFYKPVKRKAIQRWINSIFQNPEMHPIIFLSLAHKIFLREKQTWGSSLTSVPLLLVFLQCVPYDRNEWNWVFGHQKHRCSFFVHRLTVIWGFLFVGLVFNHKQLIPFSWQKAPITPICCICHSAFVLSTKTHTSLPALWVLLLFMVSPEDLFF